jgi:hypothetical protein
MTTGMLRAKGGLLAGADLLIETPIVAAIVWASCLSLLGTLKPASNLAPGY